MDLAEGLCKHLIARVLKQQHGRPAIPRCALSRGREAESRKNQRSEMGLIDRLKFVLENPFERITYTDAIRHPAAQQALPEEAVPVPRGMGRGPAERARALPGGEALQEAGDRNGLPRPDQGLLHAHQRPGDFGYSDKGNTVAAMDVLFPGIGEIIGGSQREERPGCLEARMDEMGVPKDQIWWYLDTRRFGTVPHAGFGLGLERFVLFVTGMGNIRDVIPFPRTPKSAEF
jgi:asparaginyl-tRNA synthetase